MATDYWVSLSVRDDSDEYLGSAEIREQAENALRDAAEKNKLPYKRIP
jgi:threonyl-tRNA synthetase